MTLAKPTELPSSEITADPVVKPSNPPITSFPPLIFAKRAKVLPTPLPTIFQMHVRGLESFQYSQYIRPPRHETKQKTKRSQIYISDVESVVKRYSAKIESDPVDQTTSFPIPNIRKPQQVRFSKTQLTDMARKVVTDPSHVEILAPLFDRIESFTAFDRNEYETQMWSSKYAPSAANFVITSDYTGINVTQWLVKKFEQLKKTPQNHTQLGLLKPRKVSKRKLNDEFDDFIESCYESQGDLPSSPPIVVESDASDIPSFLILCGASGSGKTSSVYAAANELDAYTFEMNPSDKRSSKSLFEKLGGMGHSHLVHKNKGNASQESDFKQKSVILLDEVDTLFEDDQTFWSGLDKFVETSRRPVIMTCTNPSFLPPTLIENHTQGFTFFYHASTPLQMDALWLIALCEGHIIDHHALRQLVIHNKNDFRSCLNDLQFWCQMALGDRRSGLNWLITQRERVQTNQEHIRVISNGTYIGKARKEDCRPLDLIPDSSVEELNFRAMPASSSLSDWCSFTESLSDADYLCANKRTQFETSVEDEHTADKILGCVDLTDIPGCVGPYPNELSIYPSIAERACNMFASDITEQADPICAINGQGLRDSLWYLSSRTGLTSSAAYNCIETSSTSVISTEILPMVRSIARMDKWREAESMRIQAEQGSSNRRMMKSVFSSMGFEPNLLDRYLDGNLDEILSTAPAYWIYSQQK